MKLTNEQIQQILDGAPEGATHVNCYEGDCVYLCMNGWMWLQYTGKDWFDVNEEPLMHYIGFNNLSDLREILELRQEVERLKAQQSEVAARAVEWGFLQGFNGALPLEESAVKSSFEINTHDAIDRFEMGKRHLAKQYSYQYANQLREQGDE